MTWQRGPTHSPPMHLILHWRRSPSGPMAPENLTSMTLEKSVEVAEMPSSAISGGVHFVPAHSATHKEKTSAHTLTHCELPRQLLIKFLRNLLLQTARQTVRSGAGWCWEGVGRVATFALIIWSPAAAEVKRTFSLPGGAVVGRQKHAAGQVSTLGRVFAWLMSCGATWAARNKAAAPLNLESATKNGAKLIFASDRSPFISRWAEAAG